MNDWLNNPALQTLDPVKLALIQSIISQTSGKSGRSLAPILMSLITKANQQGIQFTPDEFTCILNAMKEKKSVQEQLQIDQMIKLIQSMLARQNLM